MKKRTRIRIRKKASAATREERLIARIQLLEQKLGIIEGINENLRNTMNRYHHEAERHNRNYAELRKIVEHHDPELYKKHQQWVRTNGDEG